MRHDLLTGGLVTWISCWVNQTPIDWHSKKQATAEATIHASGFVAACTCVEWIINLCLTLFRMEVNVHNTSCVFGGNELMVDSATRPHRKLHK